MNKNFFGKIKQSAVIVMVVVVISKLIGMLRDVVLANYYGTSNVSDAYLIAVSVPTLLFYFIGHALSTAFQPIYNKVKVEKSELEADTYMNNLVCVSLIISAVLVVVLLAFPAFVVKLFASGFDAETNAIAVKIIRISSPSLFFMTIVNVWSGYLHAKNNFIVSAGISLPRNISIIISIVISALYGLEWLGIGLLLAYFFEFLLLLPFVLKNGFKPRILINFKCTEIKETWGLVVPIILGVGVSQINKIIDRSLASIIAVGAISALTYASVINTAIQEILVTTIITILFANCAKLVAEGNDKLVKQKLNKTLAIMQMLLIPAMFGVIVLAEPIVKLLLFRGSFDNNSLNLTVTALRFYTIGLIFVAFRDTMVKVFYAYKETKLTTIISIISIIINIIFNFILAKYMGVSGLALATSISAIVNCVVLFILLVKKIGDFNLKGLFANLIKTIFIAAVMAIIVYFIYNVWLPTSLNYIVKLFVSILIGIVTYIIFSIIIKNIKIKEIVGSNKFNDD